jgi:hypothetical protein
MIKTDIGKKPQKPSLLGGLFGGGGNKSSGEVSLFGSKKAEKKQSQGSSFYGAEDDEGDSFNSSFYDTGGQSGGTGERKKGQESEAKLAFLKYMGWVEYLIIAVEIFLIIYTFLVLMNLAPLF